MILQELWFQEEAPLNAVREQSFFCVVSEKQPNLDPFYVSSLLNCHERT